VINDLPEIVRINAPNVVSEKFEREVVVVNLESGCYFSLLGSAPTIWQQLEAGAMCIKDLLEAVIQAYDCTGMDASALMTNFLKELLDQALIVPAEPTERFIDASKATPNDMAPFEPPILEVFTDLQDILLLDPIHDVDDAGWPVAAPPA
jgi:hypothetical protein